MKRDEIKNKKYQCPVCGEYTLPGEHEDDTCNVCKWVDDIIAYDELDEIWCLNITSINEARRIWEKYHIGIDEFKKLHPEWYEDYIEKYKRDHPEEFD